MRTLNRRLSSFTLVVMATFASSAAHAQAMPINGSSGLDVEAASPLPSAPASASTFTQLSRPQDILAVQASAMPDTVADREYDYLLLGLAAFASLAFVSRRHRRAATGTAPRTAPTSAGSV